MIINKANSQLEVNLDLLDASQRQPVESTSENIVIKAPAGSGKTSTLITAVADYRYEHINDRICAITYTRAARAEMEARLQEMGVYDVEVTTIHVWARNLLNDFSIKYDFKIKIIEESQIKEILKDIVKDYLLRSKVKSVNVEILYSYVTGNKHMDITDNYRKTLNALEGRYIHYKRNHHLYDFTDYPLYLYDVMTAYDEYINNIDALFVDEFQDVDGVQLDTFKRVNAKKKFFIGDPWQSIFIFRGADGEVFKKLDNFSEYKLKYNYRSYQEIIDYASLVYEQLYLKVADEENCYISMINWTKPSSIKCRKKYGGKVVVIDPYGEVSEFTGANNCKVHYDIDFILEEFLSKSPMILCRTNKQVKAIQENTLYSTETVHQAKGLEYDDVIVIDTTIKEEEDLNIAYVALTRAKNSVLVINWTQFEKYVLGGKKW